MSISILKLHRMFRNQQTIGRHIQLHTHSENNHHHTYLARTHNIKATPSYKEGKVFM